MEITESPNIKAELGIGWSDYGGGGSTAEFEGPATYPVSYDQRE